MGVGHVDQCVTAYSPSGQQAANQIRVHPVAGTPTPYLPYPGVAESGIPT